MHGPKTNPHLIRDMIVTHVRSQGIASDAELEALARFMGHSSAMQKRRTTGADATGASNPGAFAHG